MTPVLVATAGAGSSPVAIGVAVVATLVVVALLVALLAVVRASRALREAAEELSASSRRLVEDMGGTLALAHAELDRVDDLVGSAESLTETVGSASRAAYLSVANPFIKVMAFRRGSARAVQSWRARSGGPRRRPSLLGLALRATLPARRR